MSVTGFEFIEVSKRYGDIAALVDLTLTIPSGSHFAVLGPSGCGKSSLLRLMAGLEEPTSGSILLDGSVVSAAGKTLCVPHLRGVSMLFQDLALWPNLSIRENVRLGLTRSGLSRRESTQRVAESLALCGVGELALRLPNQLSGGQQQRAALARAIAVHPRFLLLDEPFAGVDLATKSRLLSEIKNLSRDRRFQVILVSHDPLDAVELCESTAILEQGRLRAIGKLSEMFAEASLEPFQSFKRIQSRIQTQIGQWPTVN